MKTKLTLTILVVSFGIFSMACSPAAQHMSIVQSQHNAAGQRCAIACHNAKVMCKRSVFFEQQRLLHTQERAYYRCRANRNMLGCMKPKSAPKTTQCNDRHNLCVTSCTKMLAKSKRPTFPSTHPHANELSTRVQ